jgi:hypothetical protein
MLRRTSHITVIVGEERRFVSGSEGASKGLRIGILKIGMLHGIHRRIQKVAP